MTHPRDDIDLETPEVDAAEQSRVAVPSWQEDDAEEALSAGAEVNEWDAQEQGRVVEFDDDYR